MKRIPTVTKSGLLSAMILTLMGTILHTIALFTCFDSKIGYFDPSPLTTVLIVLSFAAVLVPAALCIVTPKGSLPTVWPEHKRNLAPVLPFALFACSALWMMWLISRKQVTSSVAPIIVVLALASAVYYILIIGKSRGSHANANILTVIGCAPVFWGVLSVAETYTDQLTTMNSPVKMGLQYGFLTVMLLTVSELRFLWNKALPRAAVCFHCIALYFCMTVGVSTLIAYAAGILTRSIHATYALALLGVGVYALIRLIAYMTLTPEEPSAPDTENEMTELPVVSTEAGNK